LAKEISRLLQDLTNDLNNSNLTTAGEVFISFEMAGIDGKNDPEMKTVAQKSSA
jgi:hypothetical protein